MMTNCSKCGATHNSRGCPNCDPDTEPATVCGVPMLGTVEADGTISLTEEGSRLLLAGSDGDQVDEDAVLSILTPVDASAVRTAEQLEEWADYCFDAASRMHVIAASNRTAGSEVTIARQLMERAALHLYTAGRMMRGNRR